MAAKDKPRLTKLLALAEIIDGEIDKPATPDN